ncbi:MAG: response regulator [Verrucomicrobiota bacterium]
MQAHRLLIVEDELILAMDLQDRLADLGYTVVSMVSTGEAAVTAALEHLPDLILMDIRLAGDMDGITAAREIRRRHDIPVIFMSAYADEETRQRSLTARPAGFIPKLANDRELLTGIKAALR